VAKIISVFFLMFGSAFSSEAFAANSGGNVAARISELLHQGSCQLDQLPANRIGRSAGAISGEFVTGDSQRRSFAIEIQIFGDGTYWAHYQEFVAPSELGGAEWSEEHLKQIVEGNWQAVGDELVLIGLGKVAFSIDPAGAAQPQFTLGTKLVSETAVGLSASLHTARTYMGPKRACDMRTL
jgi:hypothetical protein